jgi:response regulator RpfG family c-di-GMP phosphodiesterase
MSNDEDDKPTVVLDLSLLKKQKIKQEEDLANVGADLEFNVPQENDLKAFIEEFPKTETKTPLPQERKTFTVILFDFQSDFFQNSQELLPPGYDYQIATDLTELNKLLASKTPQIVVFNYDVNPKAVNQLSAQIKQKFPLTKTLIMAKSISPQKAKLHQASPSGAHGYYQFPLDAQKVDKELQKMAKKF